MQRFARIVLGYHGCLEPLASDLVTGKIPVEDWPRSKNRWDWLGEGIYFWEHAPERALRWAEEKARRTKNATPAVVGAVIQLGVCFDLTNVAYTEMLEEAFRLVEDAYRRAGQPLPKNRGRDQDLRGRDLDCMVINYCLAKVAPVPFQTVRGAFWEGKPTYPGARIRKESHIQIAVRDPYCILGVFRPILKVQ